MFNEIHAQREVQTNDATSFLYTRIQELEASLVNQRMLLEASKQREMSLHRTIDGFAQLLAAKSESLSLVEEKIKKIETQELHSSSQVRLLSEELDTVQRKEANRLIGSGRDESLTPQVTNEELLREVNKLRVRLELKTKEANTTMAALNAVMDAQQHVANGASSHQHLSQETVASLVREAVELHRHVERELSNGNVCSSPTFLLGNDSGDAQRRTPNAGFNLLSRNTVPGGSGATISKQHQLMARENLELKEALSMIQQRHQQHQ